MAWCERNRVGYIFGLAGNPVLLRQVGPLAEDAALGRLDGDGDKVRRYGDFRYAAKSWTVERRVIARVEAGPQGADSRFIVTNLPGPAEIALRESLLRQRTSREPDQGAQAAPRLRPHLLQQGHRQSVPTVGPHRRLLADADLAWPGSENLVLARSPVRHHPPLPDQSRRARDRDGHPHQNRPADCIPLPKSASPCSPATSPSCRRSRGGGCPQTKPSGPTSNPAAASPTPPTTVPPTRCRTVVFKSLMNEAG